MESFAYPIETDNKLYSKTMRALAGRAISLQPDEDVEHPYRPIQLAVTGLATTLDTFLERLKALPIEAPTLEQNRELIRVFQDVTYRAAEYFECYAKLASKYLPRHKKKHKQAFGLYEARHKVRRDLWALICNRLKHNSNIVQLTQQTELSSGDSLIAFQICQPAGLDRLVTNTNVHKGGGRSWSFNSALRQLVYDVLAVDQAGQTLVNNITPDLAAPTPCPDLSMPLMSAIRAIDQLSRRALEGEPFPKPGFSLTSVQIECGKIALLPFKGEIKAAGFLHNDGVTRSFEVADR